MCLKQDVYYLEKFWCKIEVLIFGFYDSFIFEMMQKMFDYFDILWGVEIILWLMYYFNGLDNSLILVFILLLKDFFLSFKELMISSVVELWCVEMLLQVNIFDECEMFLLLCYFVWQNVYYFMLCIIFNQFGYFVMVVVFDLLINDLILFGMIIDSFCIEFDLL